MPHAARKVARAILNFFWPQPVAAAVKHEDTTVRLFLRRDGDRLHVRPVGLFVRAKTDSGKMVACDVAHLTKWSLIQWLRLGGQNRYAEDLCGILLGHGRLHEDRNAKQTPLPCAADCADGDTANDQR